MQTLIVGLGNPGDRYEKTYHNIGFLVVDALFDAVEAQAPSKKFKSLWSQANYRDHKIHLLKPQTYMNLSGEAVGPAARFFKIPPERVLVVSDDLDLPTGRLRLRKSGSAGGHNGLKSIIEILGTNEFPRLRVGIGRADVLGKVKKSDRDAMEAAIERAKDAILCFLDDGVDKAMSVYNQAVTQGDSSGT